jgi:glycosyltransferase involved in cell wall biosynthesis
MQCAFRSLLACGGSAVTTVALVHEWLAGRSGSEKTFEQMAVAFPDADLFALSREPGTSYDFDGRQVRTTWLDTPLFRRHRSLALPIMPFAWRSARSEVPSYDLVVTSSHAFANLAHVTKQAKTVLSYCHTPARYLWLPGVDSRLGLAAVLAKPVRRALQECDLRGAARVDRFAVNSHEVETRVREFYGRDSEVIPPPVEVDFFSAFPEPQIDERLPERFLLAISRWIEYKRLDLAIETAAQLEIPIVIAGSGPFEARLRSVAEATGADVRFFLSPTQDELRELYSRASAVLFPAFEDFGIVPVEAQAAGTPVVAFGKGGALDTVVNGETGVFALEQTVPAFASATESCLALAEDPDTSLRCRANASGFSEETFRRRLVAWAGDSHG